MENNDTETVKTERKIYTKEVLNALRKSELSNEWPKHLDRNCINCHGQWDPVKSFDSTKPTDIKRNIVYENKTYRNNDKSKDDISLRPERRKWNDGCQVSNNKRNNEDSHPSILKYKSYQATVPNNSGADFEKRSFSRNNSRGGKPRETERDSKYNNVKLERSSRNNSNADEYLEDKDEQKYNFKSGNNMRNNDEPEWFSNGPENYEETIELRGITANDSSIIRFKKDSSRIEVKEEHEIIIVKEADKVVTDFAKEKPIFIETCITSPKREGSRFQDIFQKETKNNNLKESREVENIIKAVLSENVSMIDAERLTNASKPLPNGVLTVEEIEKGMITAPMEFQRTPSKSTTIDTLTSFEPSLNSLLSSGVTSPNADNSKVVNWLSNLNMSSAKEPEIEHKPFYPDTQNFPTMNNVAPPQPMYMPVGYPKFPPNLQHPPGLPLMLNTGHMQQQQTLHQQQQQTLHQQQHQQAMQQSHSLQQQQQQQQQHQHLSLQQTQSMHQSLQNQKQLAFLKQLNMGQSNNINMSQRNPLLMNIQPDGFMMDKYKLSSQQSAPNGYHLDQSVLSSYMHKGSYPMNHISDRGGLLMNGPPGLTNMSMSRPIVKTNPQFGDFAQMNELSHYDHPNYHQQHKLGSGGHFGTPLLGNPPGGAEMLKQAQYGQLDVFKNMRSREPGQPPMGPINNYQGQQTTAPGPYMAQRSSSNKMLANLFNVSSSYLPPLPQQAKYADQIETENI